jgi:cysteine-rich repeat protein
MALKLPSSTSTTQRVAAFVVAAIGFVTACSGKLTDVPPVGVVKCTAGTNIGCQCADQSVGTKRCRPDGVSFGPCQRSETEPCPENGEPTPTPDAGTELSVADKCPGQPIAFRSGPLVIPGDTTMAMDDFNGNGSCAGGRGAPDVVYELKALESGSLKIEVVPEAGFDVNAYVRRDSCSDETPAGQNSCSATAGPGAKETLAQRFNMAVGQSLWLFIDGVTGRPGTEKGKFSVSLSFATGPFCGDGKVTKDEVCDDANDVDGDGCNRGCMVFDGTPPSAGECPGQEIHLWPGKTFSGGGTTDQSKPNSPVRNNSTAPGAKCMGTNAAADHTYRVIPEASGTMTVTVRPTNFDAILIARDAMTCSGSGATLACADVNASTASETLTLAVTKGKEVSVSVDGASSAEGDYNISFGLRP